LISRSGPQERISDLRENSAPIKDILHNTNDYDRRFRCLCMGRDEKRRGVKYILLSRTGRKSERGATTFIRNFFNQVEKESLA